MQYDVIIVGGGAAGLTASAYLSRAGYKILCIEKEPKTGGLVSSFEKKGIYYDGGIRAIEDSGILLPMLNDLGIDLHLVKNKISIGLEDKVIEVNQQNSLEEYQKLLIDFYPESEQEIKTIILELEKIMHYMQIQYGIENPLFFEFKEHPEFYLNKVLPWMFRFVATLPKIQHIKGDVVAYLRKFTQNEGLLDFITQHFFADTPAYFALSYMNLYLDYYYPKGGTTQLTQQLQALIEENNGTIQTNTFVEKILPEQNTLIDSQGNQYQYQQLVWAADLKSFYKNTHLDQPYQKFEKRKQLILNQKGNDSIFALFLGVELSPSYFDNIATGHFFYTPNRIGESSLPPLPIGQDKQTIKAWLTEFFKHTTYEIAIPSLRDPDLAKDGKLGLVISMLFEYDLTQYIMEQGWYDEFKQFSANQIINTLNSTIYPGLQEHIVDQFTSTPLTFERYTNNTHGAINGWAYSNRPFPAESRLIKIANSVKTPFANIHQAGHWTYSPSGLPIALLTGKMAADKAQKNLK